MKKSILIATALVIGQMFFQTMKAQEIFDAVKKGDLIKVKELVAKNPKIVKAKDDGLSTPLHIAAEVDNEAIARFLIEKGADINALNGSLLTPLMMAGIGVAEMLVKQGVDINFISPNGNSTALVWAFIFEKKDVAEYLLGSGAKLPEAGTPNCFINLQCALKIGCLKYLEKYLQAGNSPLIVDESQNTLMHYAAEFTSVELIDTLIGLGVPINKYNISGRAPLHIAAYNGNLKVVDLLIKKGIDKNERTVDGKTPYNLSVENKKTDVVNYLLSIGADKSGPKFPVLEGEYLGQPKPGKTPIPFAPGIVAVNTRFHGSIIFSPDGNEAWWSVQDPIRIFTSKRVNGRWTMPDTDISIANGDVPFISPDGNKFYFMKEKRTPEGTTEVICARDKTPSGWSEPHNLPDIINSVPGIHWQMSVDRQGNLFFGCRQNGSIESRIYYSEFKNGKYSKPKKMESLKNINAASPYISPDGTYLIVSAETSDEILMILFKKKDGIWTHGLDITSIIGKTGMCPIVTNDGKYLFFIADIPYWVDASFIEELRKKELKDEM